MLRRTDCERIVILLGSIIDFAIGFDVTSESHIESFEELQRSFSPQAPGTNKNHQVRVKAEPRIHAGIKYHMVDIVMEAMYHPPNPFGIIREIISELQSRPDEP